MNLLDTKSVWQAHNLPDGLSFSNGIISGTPTTRGTFSVPVSVSNSLGSDTKNIIIIVKHRNDCVITQNGEILETITPQTLLASVQDGTAQSKYNCNNTQMLINLINPLTGENVENVALNFCAFREVTLQDGSTKSGLILQFDKALWSGLAPFDINGFNRWKYSHLRQWLNSSGSVWLSSLYLSDVMTTINGSYTDSNIKGFLDYLPAGLVDALSPVKIITQAWFDDDNDDTSIGDPEDVDGFDADITYDKVFIPSLSEMNFSADGTEFFPDDSIEGEAWTYFASNSPTFMDLGGNTCSLFSRSAVMNGKNKVFALNSDAEAVQLIPSVSSAATAPAFVIC